MIDFIIPAICCLSCAGAGFLTGYYIQYINKKLERTKNEK
jgi:hypothetical protein